jgi:quercetin dioxygenase-like cupin family protein
MKVNFGKFLGVGVVVGSIVAAAQGYAQTPPTSSRQMLMTKEMADLPGKEAVVFQVTYPPGTSNLPHRHDAHVFLHLVEGQLQVQVKGGELVDLKPGSTYYENPADIHVVSRNPSSVTPARALIFMVHDKGKALSTPVKE